MEKNKFIREYCERVNAVNKGLEIEFKGQNKDRAYGGFIRSKKGKLLETLVEDMIINIWIELGYERSRIEINAKKTPIKLNLNYIKNIKNQNKYEFLCKDIDKNIYKCSVDKHIFIDKEFIFAIECKNYTENAMIKRIFVDFVFLKKTYPNIKTYLIQFESQLGGDYSLLKSPDDTLGSRSTNTIASYFPDVDLQIRTLISGERKVSKPIFKKEFFKEFTEKSFNVIYSEFELLLSNYN